MANEYGSTTVASSTPGQMSALDFGSGWGGPSSNIDLSTTDLSSLSTGDLFGGSSTPSTDWSNVGGGDLSSIGSATGVPNVDLSSLYAQGAPTGGTTPSPAGGAQGSSWWQQLLSGAGSAAGGWSGLGKSVAGLGPYAAVAGIGMSQAKDVQKQNEARAKQLADLGGPYTAAGQALLKQFQSGQIRPDQQAVADLAKTSGQTLIDSGSGLSAIAQSAYKDYQSGKLPAADEQRLADQIASQKQQLRARLGNITDSSILAGYDSQIDNQAQITRQDLLDKRFATGNQAYDEWLKSTTQGQQLKLQGAEFASKSLDQMLNQALALSSEGMAPVSQSIQLAMQSDQQLSQQMSELLGNLAAAYAYTRSGPGSGSPGGGAPGAGQPGGAAGGGAGGALGSVAKTAGTGLLKAIGGSALDAAAGGGIAASASAAVAGLGTELAASTAAAEGGVAASVAAENSAWLAASAPAAAAPAAGAAPAAAAGSLGLGLAGVGLAAAPAIYGASRNPVDLHKSYWQGMDKTLQAGKNDPQYWNTVSQLLGMQSQDPVNSSEASQMLAKYGIDFYQNPNVTQGAAVSRVGSRATQKA